METGTRDQSRAVYAGAVAFSKTFTQCWQLIDIKVLFDVAPTTSENVVIAVTNEDGDTWTEDSWDAAADGDLTQGVRLDKRFDEDTTITVTYTNTDTNAVTVLLSYQLDDSAV